MGRPAVAGGRRAVDRRADQGMPEPQVVALHGDQPGTFGGVERPGIGTERQGRPGHDLDVLGVVGRGHEEDRRVSSGSRRTRSLKAASSWSVSGSWSGSGAVPVSWASVRRPGQLDERQRVAGGLGEDPVGDRGGAVGRAPQQHRRRFGSERLQRQRRQVAAVEAAHVGVAGPEQQGDPLAAPSRRATNCSASADARVEPVGVVDQAEDGTGARPAPTAPSGRPSTPGSVPGRCRRPSRGRCAERGRAACSGRRVHAGPSAGPEQLVEPGEGQLGLGLDAAGGEHLHVVAGCCCSGAPRGAPSCRPRPRPAPPARRPRRPSRRRAAPRRRRARHRARGAPPGS